MSSKYKKCRYCLGKILTSEYEEHLLTCENKPIEKTAEDVENEERRKVLDDNFTESLQIEAAKVEMGSVNTYVPIGMKKKKNKKRQKCLKEVKAKKSEIEEKFMMATNKINEDCNNEDDHYIGDHCEIDDDFNLSEDEKKKEKKEDNKKKEKDKSNKKSNKNKNQQNNNDVDNTLDLNIINIDDELRLKNDFSNIKSSKNEKSLNSNKNENQFNFQPQKDYGESRIDQSQSQSQSDDMSISMAESSKESKTSNHRKNVQDNTMLDPNEFSMGQIKNNISVDSSSSNDGHKQNFEGKKKKTKKKWKNF